MAVLEREKKRWTKEEDEFLLSHVGERSFDWIAQKLKRSPYAVESRMYKLKIWGVKEQTDWISAHQMSKIIQVDYKTIKRWQEQYGFPLKQKSLRFRDASKTFKKKKTYYIKPKEFWNWLKDHTHLLSLRDIDEKLLAPVPHWFYEERKKQQPKSKRKKYTAEEDEKVWNWFYNGVSQKEIARRLGRSVNSVERRIWRLRKVKMKRRNSS